MTIEREQMTELEQRAMRVGQRFGEARPLCDGLAKAELECCESVKGTGGENSSAALIEKLSTAPFSLSRFSATF